MNVLDGGSHAEAQCQRVCVPAEVGLLCLWPVSGGFQTVGACSAAAFITLAVVEGLRAALVTWVATDLAGLVIVDHVSRFHALPFRLDTPCPVYSGECT